MTRFVLASASPARLSVLRNAGVDPVVRVSNVDEDALLAALAPDLAPTAIVLELAKAKARFVARELTAGLDGVCWLDGADALDCVVVGCDSMLLIDGQLQGKPGSDAAVEQRWKAMSSNSGELLTGHCVLRIRDGVVVDSAAATARTVVVFGEPTDEELDAYIATGEPHTVAGAFTLDGRGGWFVAAIEGDPSSVIGISLPIVRQLLSQVGISIAALWQAN